MAPAKIVRYISRNFLKKHGTVYFLEPGHVLDSTYDGFDVRDFKGLGTEKVVFTQENRRIAVSPDGRNVFIPYKNKEKK
ncbi:MAG: hypothetical protein NT149_00030 [Candidatus Gottesmanbacteria bacterium]|nr:hypothetical protein [Candidatus Gottesmanbacteria bacterium]